MRGANHYTWTDSATGGPILDVVSFPNAPLDSSTVIVAPTTTRGYCVQGDLVGSCKNRDTITINNAPLFSLSTTTQDSVVCKYASTILTTTQTPVQPGTNTYNWSPALTTATGSTSTYGILQNTMYHVTVTSASGCPIQDSVLVRVNGAAAKISIIPSNNNVCPGDTVTLHSVIRAENLVPCGLVDSCFIGGIQTTGYVNNGTANSTTVGSPFRGAYNSYKVQYLIRASELYAAGMRSGNITDLAFYVASQQSPIPYDTFEVSMGCTSLDSLTGFQNNLAVVAPRQQYTPNAGWSPILFLDPTSFANRFFGWDGASNLVVQVCYTINPNSGSANDLVSFTTTSFGNSVAYQVGNSGNGCDFNAPTFGRNRPNIRFNECSPNVITYQWTPSTLAYGGCDVCDSTRVVVYSDTTFHLTVSDYNCHNDTLTRVRVNPNLATHILPHDPTICLGDTVGLRVSLVNPPIDTCIQNYFVSSIPYAPVSGAQNIIPYTSFIPQVGTYSDDGSAGSFPIGFTFPFYCTNYTDFWVNANGFIDFLNPANCTSSTTYISQPLPTPLACPSEAIILMWGDYRVDASSTIGYFLSGTGANQFLVVKYNNLTSLSTTYQTNGEMHLYQDGTIDILLQSSNYSNTNHTTGVKHGANIGTAATGHNNQQYTVNTPEAWRFIPQRGQITHVNSSLWTSSVGGVSSSPTYLTDSSIVNPIASPPTTTTYVATSQVKINAFTNPSFCTVHDTVRVTVDNLQHTLVASPAMICSGDSSHLIITTASQIDTVRWTPGFSVSNDTILSPYAHLSGDSAIYRVYMRDHAGCKAYDSVVVRMHPVQFPNIGQNRTICYSAQATLVLNPSTGYSNFQWYKEDTATHQLVIVPGATLDSITVRPSGYYTLRTQGTNGCFYFSDTVHVDSFPRVWPRVNVNGLVNFCIGNSTILTVTQNMTNYQWTPPSTQQALNVTSSATYSYTATDLNGCPEFSDTVAISVTPQPVIHITPGYKNPLCTGESDTITATVAPVGTPLHWTSGGTTVSTDSVLRTGNAGTYYVTPVSGCPAIDSVVLTHANSPVASLTSVTECNCNPDTLITPSVNPPGTYTYSWNGGSTTTSQLHITLPGTNNVSVVVTDVNNCTATASASYVFNCPQISVSTRDTSIFVNDSTILTATPSTLASYMWTAGDSGIVYNPTASSTYVSSPVGGIDTFYLRVTDAIGCTKDTFILIRVTLPGGFVMPGAFTPNGDSKNQHFGPKLAGGSNSTAKVITFRIYNRWGQTMFDDPNGQWDGNFNSIAQPTETYLYFVTIEIPDPKDSSKRIQQSREGSFQLFR